MRLILALIIIIRDRRAPCYPLIIIMCDRLAWGSSTFLDSSSMGGRGQLMERRCVRRLVPAQHMHGTRVVYYNTILHGGCAVPTTLQTGSNARACACGCGCGWVHVRVRVSADMRGAMRMLNQWVRVVPWSLFDRFIFVLAPDLARSLSAFVDARHSKRAWSINSGRSSFVCRKLCSHATRRAALSSVRTSCPGGVPYTVFPTTHCLNTITCGCTAQCCTVTYEIRILHRGLCLRVLHAHQGD